MVMNFQNPYYTQQLRVLVINTAEEASRIPADINGSPLFFYNKNTNEIYVKQFYIGTGITTFDKYIKFEGDSKPNNEEKKENDINISEEKYNALNDRINGLYEILQKKDIKNAK